MRAHSMFTCCAFCSSHCFFPSCTVNEKSKEAPEWKDQRQGQVFGLESGFWQPATGSKTNAALEMNHPFTSNLYLSSSYSIPISPPHTHFILLPLSFLFVLLYLPFFLPVAGLERGVVSVETEADCQGGKQHVSGIKANSKANICCLADV